MELSHYERIVHMGFFDIQDSTAFLGFCSIGNLDMDPRAHLFHFTIQLPPDCCHVSCVLERSNFRLPTIQFSTRFMIGWCMALFTYRDQIGHPVGSTLTPILDMMSVQDCAIFDASITALAFIPIPCKDGFPERCNSIPFSMLVISSLRYLLTFFLCFQNLRIKVSYLQRDVCNWIYSTDSSYDLQIDLFLMFQ